MISIYHEVVQGSQNWHSIRKRTTYNSSTVGDILGLGCYDSPKKATLKCLQKIHGIRSGEKPNDFLLKAFAYGHTYEKVASDRFEHLVLSKKILPMGTGELKVKEIGTYELKPEGKSYTIGVSPDRIVCTDSHEFPLEIKCPYGQRIYDIKPSHWVQMQLQMKAIDATYGYYMCWSPHKSLIKHVPLNERMWHVMTDMLEEHKKSFIDKYVPGRDHEIIIKRGIFKSFKKTVLNIIKKETSYVYVDE